MKIRLRCSSVLRLILLLGLPLQPACRTPAAADPQETLRRYLAALESDRPDLAYALLDEGVRRQLTPSEFAARWKSFRPELKAQAAELRSALGKPIVAKAQVRYPGGGEASLTYAEKRWQIDDSVALSVGPNTPADALRAFIRAVERRSYPAVLRCLSRSARETIERDISERLDKLRRALNREIEVSGGRARLQYDSRFKIELVEEEGQWRILDLD